MFLTDNQLSGEIPAELRNLAALPWLYLHNNTQLAGELPLGLKDLSSLNTLKIQCTGVPVPDDADFRDWLATITFEETCTEDPVDTVTTPPVDPELEPELEPSSGGGGCAVALNVDSATPKSKIFNLFLILSAMFLAVSWKTVDKKEQE